MRPSPLWLPLPAFLLAVLAGCSTTSSCGGNQDYLQAQERPLLQLPPSMVASERIKPVVIPALAPNTQKLDPQPRCLDYPPPYFAKKGKVADSAEDAVRAWAAAWAERKPGDVMQMYSPSFQAPGEGGSAAFLQQREQQVDTGRAPSATLQDVVVTAQGTNRRVVTFIQVFGQDRIRKELTLVSEGGAWKIVSERTLEVL